MKYNRDLKLVKDLQAGKEQSLKKCIKRYAPYVAYIVGNIIGNSLPQEDKEEVISDVFVTLWEKSHLIDVRRTDCLKSYIGAIARNLSKNKLRDSQTIVMTELNQDIAAELNIEDIIINMEQSEALMRCILKLKKVDQICFFKFYYYRKTIREIATEQGISESAVKSKLVRGRERIKSMLLQEENNGES